MTGVVLIVFLLLLTQYYNLKTKIRIVTCFRNSYNETLVIHKQNDSQTIRSFVQENPLTFNHNTPAQTNDILWGNLDTEFVAIGKK